MPRLRVVTWNLWQYSVPWGYPEPRGVVAGYPAAAPRPGPGALWAHRRAALLATLRAERPDLLLLQEAASDEDAAPGQTNQAAQLAAALGYVDVYRAASVARRRRAEHGQAVLAAPGWQAGAAATLPLPSAGRLAKDCARNALCVDLVGPAGAVRVVVVHLSLDAAARLASTDLLLDWLGRRPGTPALTVLAGDCNDVPGSPPLARLARAGWQDAWAALRPDDPGPTFPTPDLFLRLDYVFVAPGAGAAPVQARRLGLAPDAAGFFPSDHAGLLVDLDSAASSEVSGNGRLYGTLGYAPASVCPFPDERRA